MLTFRAGFENVNVLLSLRLGDFSKSAFLGLIYEKAIKLKNTGNQSAGEVCYHIFHQKMFCLSFFRIGCLSYETKYIQVAVLRNL